MATRQQTRRDAALGLLESEVTFMKALREHESCGDELSRRVLWQARVQMELAAEEAWRLSTRASPLDCRRCGCAPTVERWQGSGRRLERESPGDPEVRLVSGAPPWAAIYALQGCTRVTRYTCAGCGFVIAILAADEDAPGHDRRSAP